MGEKTRVINVGKMSLLITLILSLVWLLPQYNVRADTSGPLIDVWYGDAQYFGDPGLPARQIYILGNVSDADGVKSLEYSLNGGGFEPLQLGPFPASPNGPRLLYGVGDFAVELFDGELNEGANTLVLRARDNSDNTNEKTVTVNYTHNKKWPLPTTTTWNAGSDTWQWQAQVLTGKWNFASGSVRTQQVGYDRMIAIGDMGWRDYEVQVNVTIHDIDSVNGFNAPSYGPGVGLLLRWTGHTDEPYSDVGQYCNQPKCGYLPYGAIGWLRWTKVEEKYRTGLELLVNNHSEDDTEYSVSRDTPYTFKMRVKTLSDGPEYSLKVWPAGNPEPGNWSLTARGQVGDPISGSVVLLAHHVDATFSNVTVTPLSLELPISNAQSDDFNTCTLDTTRWTIVNPVGDGSQGIGEPFTDNAHLFLLLPASVEHDMNALGEPGGNRAVRVVQPINDTDFVFEAKFDSAVQSSAANKRPFQGLMVEESANPAMRWIRADFYSQGNGTRLYVATYEGPLNVRSGSQEGKLVWFDAPVISDNPSPLYLRMERYGSRWLISIKGPSDSAWRTVVNVPFLVQAARVGLYAGNAYGTNSPAFTAKIDYFQNLVSPIANEDALRNTLTVNVNPTGGGTISKTPDKGEYGCGETVNLVANASPGYTFANWSGDLSGTTPSGKVIMNGPKVATANFTPIPYTLTVSTIGNGTVTKSPDKATYVYGETITLTANPQPGWAFAGWSGDISGMSNPATITMAGNAIVQATFSTNRIFIPLVLR